MQPVPFILEVGVNSVRGAIRLEDAGVVVDWRRFDMLDSPKGPLQSIAIPLDQIVDIDYKKRLGGGRIVIHTKTPAALGDFPLPAGDITTLNVMVKRSHKTDAGLLAAETTLRIAEG